MIKECAAAQLPVYSLHLWLGWVVSSTQWIIHKRPGLNLRCVRSIQIPRNHLPRKEDMSWTTAQFLTACPLLNPSLHPSSDCGTNGPQHESWAGLTWPLATPARTLQHWLQPWGEKSNNSGRKNGWGVKNGGIEMTLLTEYLSNSYPRSRFWYSKSSFQSRVLVASFASPQSLIPSGQQT